MPINSFAPDCPRLLEGDILSLSPIFLLKGNLLHDTHLGAEHLLRPEAQIIVAELSESVPVSALMRRHTPDAITDVLGFINRAGGLVRYRAPLVYLRWLKDWALAPYAPLRYPAFVRRREFGARQLAIACLWASWPLLASVLTVSLLAALASVLPPGQVLGAGLFGSVVFMISLYLHELAHALVLPSKVRVDIVYRRLHLSLRHVRLQPTVEASVALAGPVTGGLFCAGVAVAGRLVHLPIIALSGITVGALHLISLLPWYGDGASLRAVLLHGATK